MPELGFHPISGAPVSSTVTVEVVGPVSNDRLADMGFCRGTLPYGPGRLPIPDGTID